MKVLVTQSCQAMDYSPPGSSAHGIPQVRILELGSHSLLQGIFLTQGWNPGLLPHRRILYHLGHQGRLPAQVLIRWGPLLSDHGQVTSSFWCLWCLLLKQYHCSYITDGDGDGNSLVVQWLRPQASRELSSVLCDDLEGWDEGGGREEQEGGGICIHISDSHCCTAETNITL